MLLNDDNVGIEKSCGICSPTFIVDEFAHYFYIHQSFLSNIQNIYK